jgi:hypothetical protein
MHPSPPRDSQERTNGLGTSSMAREHDRWVYRVASVHVHDTADGKTLHDVEMRRLQQGRVPLRAITCPAWSATRALPNAILLVAMSKMIGSCAADPGLEYGNAIVTGFVPSLASAPAPKSCFAGRVGPNVSENLERVPRVADVLPRWRNGWRPSQRPWPCAPSCPLGRCGGSCEAPPFRQ